MRVLIMHKPGSTNFPTFLPHSFRFISVAVASASARAPLVMGLTPAFDAFIAFMGAMMQGARTRRQKANRMVIVL